MRGEYLIWDPAKDVAPLILPNLVTDTGEEEFLKMIMQNVSAVAGGANFFIGMLDETPTETLTLSAITTEPTSAGTYSRKSVARNTTGWPTVATINGHKCITSAGVTFTASGANFSRAFSRLFLTDQASGTAGILYSISGPLVSPLLLVSGQSRVVQYRLYMN
jgi:hypothetical protein